MALPLERERRNEKVRERERGERARYLDEVSRVSVYGKLTVDNDEITIPMIRERVGVYAALRISWNF